MSPIFGSEFGGNWRPRVADVLATLSRWLHPGTGGEYSLPAPLPGEDAIEPADTSPFLMDANTRTFWAKGAPSPETLIEADDDNVHNDPAPPSTDTPHRLSLLLGKTRGTSHAAASSQCPPGNPGYTESLFVELMRAQRFHRAFALLTPECQAAWGSDQDFAVASREGGHDRVMSAEIKGVLYLRSWTDPRSQHAYDHAAELTVEYGLAAGTPTRVQRTVHVVAVDGAWKLLSYPSREWTQRFLRQRQQTA